MTALPASVKDALDGVAAKFPNAQPAIAKVEETLDNLLQAESKILAVYDTFFDKADNAVLVETTLVTRPLSIVLPALGDSEVMLGEDDELELQLAVRFGDTGVKLTLSDLPLSVTFRSGILRQVGGGPGAWVLLNPPDVVLKLDGATIDIDGDGTISMSDIPAVVPGPVLVGNTGIVLDLKSIQILSGNEAVPPAGVPLESQGVYFAAADVYLPPVLHGLLPSDLSAKGLFVGTGGLSGTIASTWSAPKPISLGGIACMIESLSFEFKQNALVGSSIMCSLMVPFFDQPVDLEVTLSNDGSIVASLAATQSAPDVTNTGGLVRFGLPNVYDAVLESVTFAESGGVSKLTLSGELTPKAGGLTWPTLEIRELAVDSNGHVHVDGGWKALSKAKTMDFHGAKLEVTKFAMGVTNDGGKYVGLSGKVEFVKGLSAGASADGLRIAWYPDGTVAMSFEEIGISFKTAAIQFEGHVRYMYTGTEHEFKGDLKLVIPAANDLTLIGKAVFGAKSGNTYFAIYVEGDFGTGIPLWATGLSLYGFAGLLAIGYAPAKQDPMLWYSVDHDQSWFHQPQVGVVDIVGKWTAAPKTFALGAGVTLGTAADNGHAFNGKFLLLMLWPGPIVMIDGSARVLSKRDDPSEPPFHGLIVLDNRAGYFLVGLDMQWKEDKEQGTLADMSGSMEAFFDYQHPKNWHLWLGKKDPVEQRIQARLLDVFTAKGYFMLDGQSLQLGAWVGKVEQYSWGPVKAALEAYLDSNAAVSFKPTQFHADLHLHGYFTVKVFKFRLGFGLDAILSADVFKPFHILGEVDILIETKVKNFNIQLTMEWGPNADPPPLHFPELLPVLGKGITHPKTTTEWPKEDTNSNVMAMRAASAPAIVVPVDSRPYVTFGYPMHDAIGVGVNAGPDPGWMTIGDPARGVGSARVRYVVTGVELYREGTLVAACPQPQTPGVGKVFGVWAPAIPGTAGGQNKLLLGSANPLDFGAKSASWNPWLSSNLPGYPCPDTALETVCMDFERVAVGRQLFPAWRDAQKLDFRIDWADGAPYRIVALSPAIEGYDRGLQFAPPLATSYRAYVSNYDAATVSVIDLATRTIVATVPVSPHPTQVTMSPDGQIAYVVGANGSLDLIYTAIDQTVGQPFQVPGQIADADGPVSLAVSADGTYGFIPSLHGDNIVSRLEFPTFAETANYDMPGIGRMATLSPDGQKLYVTSPGKGKVYIFDLTVDPFSLEWGADAGLGVGAIVIHPTAPRAWISTHGTVRAWDTDANAFLPSPPVTVFAAREMALSPDGTRLYVESYGLNQFSVLSTNPFCLLATIDHVNVGRLRMTPDGSALVIATAPSIDALAGYPEEIGTIDPATNQIVGATVHTGSASDKSIALLPYASPPASPPAVTINVPRGSSTVEITWIGSGPLTATVTEPAATSPFGSAQRGVIGGHIGPPPTAIASNGAPLKLDASTLGPMFATQGIDQIKLTSTVPWTLVRVCVTKLPYAGGLAEQQRVHAALDQTVELWKKPTPVLDPGVSYHYVISWSAEAQGMGALDGWSDAFTDQALVPFKTALPPSLGTLSDPNAPPKAQPTATGLDDLSAYVRTTVPVTHVPAHELPHLTKPVFRGYDVAVEFNESYVDQLYQAAGRDLDLLLFDRNNRVVRDAEGPLIIVENAWANAADVVLTDLQARWIQMFNANSCELQTIDPSLIPAAKILRAAEGHVLEADSVYQARLVPQLLHQLHVAGPLWTSPASSWSDYRASVLVTVNTAGPLSIRFRVTAAGWYELTVDPGAGRRTLARVNGAQNTVLAQDFFAYHPGSDPPYRLHVEAVGPELLVAQDGSVVFAVSDAGFPNGGVELRQPAGQTAFNDLGVSDLSTGAPVAYRFTFTTSKFTNFYHLVHGFQDVMWTADVAGALNMSAAVASQPSGLLPSGPAPQPSGDAEKRGYDAVASLALGSAAAQDPPQLEVTRLSSGGTTLGWLVRSPEPLDFTRISIALSAANRTMLVTQPPAAVKIAQAELGDTESVTLLARDAVDLSGYVVQYRQSPSALADEVGSRSLWRGGSGIAGDETWSDYRASVVFWVTTTGGGVGLQFRYQDPQNYYTFTYNLATGAQQLAKMVDGTYAVLQSAPGDPVIGSPNEIAVELAVSVQGAALAAYRAGKKVLQATDAELAVGGAGPIVFGTARTQDFEVHQLPNELSALLRGQFSTTASASWASANDGSGLNLNPLGDASWADIVVCARVRRKTGGTTGLLLRYQDPANHNRVLFTDNERRFEHVEQGVATVVWSSPVPLAVARTYEIAATVVGATFVVFQDGVPMCEVFDTALPKGSVGLCAEPNADTEVSQLIVYPGELAFSSWTMRETFSAPAAMPTVQSSVTTKAVKKKLVATVTMLKTPSAVDLRFVAWLRAQPSRPVGVVFGYQSPGDLFRFSIDNGSVRRLVRVVGGLTTVLWSDAIAVDAAHEHVLTLDVIDGLVTVWIDGLRVCEWNSGAAIAGSLGLFCIGDPAAVFAAYRAGAPVWIDYYRFGAEPRLAAGNRVLIAPATGIVPQNRRTSIRVAAELDDAGTFRLPPDGTRLRVVAPDGIAQHARDVIPSAEFAIVPFQALRKADTSGIVIAPSVAVAADQSIRLSFVYKRDNGVTAFTEAGEISDETVFIDVPQA